MSLGNAAWRGFKPAGKRVSFSKCRHENEAQQMLLAEGRRKGCLSRDQLFISESLLYGSEHSEESCGQAAERLYRQQAG